MMDKKEVKIPLFYLYMHSILSDVFPSEVELKRFTNFMHEWRIPKVVRIAIVQEMENYNLVERIDRNTIRINRTPQKINTTTEMYEYVGLLSCSD